MIVLFLVFQILPYTINYFPLPWKDHIMDILNTVQPEMVTGYIGYFILGTICMIMRYQETGISGLCTGGNIDFGSGHPGLCYISSQKSGKPIQSFYENYTLAGFSLGQFCFFCFSKTMYPRSNGMKNRKRGSAIWKLHFWNLSDPCAYQRYSSQNRN